VPATDRARGRDDVRHLVLAGMASDARPATEGIPDGRLVERRDRGLIIPALLAGRASSGCCTCSRAGRVVLFAVRILPVAADRLGRGGREFPAASI
jgi:hypothetical protein